MQLLACCLLPVACFPLASCLLRVAYCQLPACLLQFACLPVAYCLVLLPTVYYLLLIVICRTHTDTLSNQFVANMWHCPTWQAVNTSCLHISRSNGNESNPKTHAFTSNVKCTQTLQQGYANPCRPPKTQTQSVRTPNADNIHPTKHYVLKFAWRVWLCSMWFGALPAALHVGVCGNCSMTVWWHGVSFYWHGVTFSSDMGWLFSDMEWAVDDV